MEQIPMSYHSIAEVFTGRGPKNAKTAREIAAILNCSVRDVTAMVNQERRAGTPICANTGGEHPGYYLPETREQVLAFCASLERREKEIHKTQKALRKALSQLPSAEEYGKRKQPPPSYRP